MAAIPRLRRTALRQQLQLSARREPARRAGRTCQATGLHRAGHCGRMFDERHRASPHRGQAASAQAAGRQPVPGRLGNRFIGRHDAVRPHGAGLQPARLRQPVPVHHQAAALGAEGHLPPRHLEHHRRRACRLRRAGIAQTHVRAGATSHRRQVAAEPVHRPVLVGRGPAAHPHRRDVVASAARGQWLQRDSAGGGRRRALPCALAQAAAGRADRHTRRQAADRVRARPAAQLRAAPAHPAAPGADLPGGIARRNAERGGTLRLQSR